LQSRWLDFSKKALKAEPKKAARSQMIICGLATGFPLLIGLIEQQLSVAILGALTGYLLTVYETPGPLRHRLAVTITTYGMLIASFFLGRLLQGDDAGFYLTLGAMAYWVGVQGGEGAEFERATLFSTLLLIIAHSNTEMYPEMALLVFKYTLATFFFVLLSLWTHAQLSKKAHTEHTSLLNYLKKPLSSRLNVHLHAFSYMTIALIAAWLMGQVHAERGYWTVITVLLVMKPDRTESLFRSFQRFIGTLTGALTSAAFVYLIHWQIPLVALISLSAFLVPWAVKKNYWLVSYFVSVMVILLLEVPGIEHGNFHTPWLRLKATAYGCLLGIGGVLISKLVSLLILQKTTSK
jgi:uncharacterized membrane protein YccC